MWVDSKGRSYTLEKPVAIKPGEPFQIKGNLMTNLFSELQDMVDAGVLTDYVVGGASAVLFYTEPFYTEDIDLYVVVPEATSPFTPLEDIYGYARVKGWKIDKEHIYIAGEKVQFLPVFSELVQGTVSHAALFNVEGVDVKVASPEYLIAILLSLGRPKDRAKLALLQSQATIDERFLQEVLTQHGLLSRWKAYRHES